MATLRLEAPPMAFHRLKGDNGSYALDRIELFSLPLGSIIEIHDPKADTTYCATAGDWKEFGHIEDGQVYLPIEYFSKK